MGDHPAAFSQPYPPCRSAEPCAKRCVPLGAVERPWLRSVAGCAMEKHGGALPGRRNRQARQQRQCQRDAPARCLPADLPTFPSQVQAPRAQYQQQGGGLYPPIYQSALRGRGDTANDFAW